MWFATVHQVCPTPGEEVDGRVVDVGCNTDKLEVCLTTALGCDALGGGCGEETQASIVEFLSCFEAGHHANVTFAEPCADAAKVDWQSVMKCYNDEATREKLWQQHLDSPARAGLEHFPTVLVNGEPWSIYNDTASAQCYEYQAKYVTQALLAGNSRLGCCTFLALPLRLHA